MRITFVDFYQCIAGSRIIDEQAMTRYVRVEDVMWQSYAFDDNGVIFLHMIERDYDNLGTWIWLKIEDELKRKAN